jgi:inosine/xanthosine triphosphatase
LAESRYLEALSLYRKHQGHLPLGLANAIRSLAVLRWEQSRALWEEARDLYTAIGIGAGIKESTARPLSSTIIVKARISTNFPQGRKNQAHQPRNFPLESAQRIFPSMKRCLIAVGSTRRPKLKAVKEATSAIAPLFEEGITLEVEGYEVEGGGSHTPTSRDELMQGARQRVEALQQNLQAKAISASYFIGLEGGLDVVVGNAVKRVFLESWVYASDGSAGHFGCSGSIELPEALAEEVLSRGTELSAAIDRFAGEVGIRDGHGAWGVLSRNLISRQESFRLAVIAAFAPFYNAKMYRKAVASGGLMGNS